MSAGPGFPSNLGTHAVANANRRLRLVYLSSLAVPHQVKLCEALQEYFDAEFWFYEYPDRKRGCWWRIPLGDHSKVLDRVLFFSYGFLEDKYYVPGLGEKLAAFDPDVVMLGGFSIPANLIAFRWAKRNHKRTVVFTERSRDSQGKLRRRGLIWHLLHWWYRDIDLVIVSAEDVKEQFRTEMGFGDKVVVGQYAADLQQYLEHEIRKAKPIYTLLFANRMTEIYNPLRAIEIFAAVRQRHPEFRLLMNAAGEMRDACVDLISALGVEDGVEFLTDIPSWNQLHHVYARADILILPARFSSGNFTVLEAMASGMGIVVSDQVMSSGKLIEDGVNGFNCPPSVEEFVDRIDRYLADPMLFEVHARINRERVASLGVVPTARLYHDLISRITFGGCP